jgi:hypothetical protein
MLPYDCIAEYLTVKSDNAAFAVIMNARYGFAPMDYTTDGPSQRYHREYWDAVFGEGKTQISKANQDSKEDNLYRINEYAMRWCYYELNLFGDPTIDHLQHINNTPPLTPMISGKTNGEAGKEYEYIFSTVDPDENDIYYYINWGDGSNSGWLGPYSYNEEIKEHHSWSRQGTYTIKAKAKDIYGAESSWTTLTVSMPKNKAFIFKFNLLNWLFERFPNAFPILRYILGL